MGACFTLGVEWCGDECVWPVRGALEGGEEELWSLCEMNGFERLRAILWSREKRGRGKPSLLSKS